MPKLLLALAAAGLAAAALAAPALAASQADRSERPAGGTREVLYVANNWDGTAHVVDPRTFRRLGRLNVVPDKERRIREIMRDPLHAGFFLGIRQLVGEGHDQFVDDLYSSPDGRFLYVSRPSFADVVAIDLATKRIAWREKLDGYRADHMAISPDGRRLAVSASTGNVVHVIDTRTGNTVGRIPTGDQPHENNYSRDGTKIFHASIGAVFTSTDEPEEDATKGERYFQILDARSFRVLKTINMARKLAAHGVPRMSSSVRPMAISPDERYVYLQLSFFHGFVEYDLKLDRPLRMVLLPLNAKTPKTRQEYLLDSAHHGLNMSPDGRKLCAAGTVSDYAAIVHRSTLRIQRVVDVGPKPYWSTNSNDGRYCFVSVSGADRVSVISYRTAREVARIRVGDHPQRMRMGFIRPEGLRGANARPAPNPSPLPPDAPAPQTPVLP